MSSNGLIFDKIRGVYLKETPEEKVRQNVITWLEKNGVAPALIGREIVLNVAGRSLRADLVVYLKDLSPFFVIECKAPSVPITEKVLIQVFEYNNELSCRYVMVTNGVDSFVFGRSSEGKFVPLDNPSEIFVSDFH